MKAQSSVGTRFFVLQNCFAMAMTVIGAKFKTSCHNEVECHNCIHTYCMQHYIRCKGNCSPNNMKKRPCLVSAAHILFQHPPDRAPEGCPGIQHEETQPCLPMVSTKHSCRFTPYCLTCETDLLSFDQMYQSPLTQSHLRRLSVSTSSILTK